MKESSQQSDAQQLKKISVILLWFLTNITFGIYVPGWYLTRRNTINNLQSEQKVGSGVFVFAIVVISIIVLISMGGFISGTPRNMDADVMLGSFLCGFIISGSSDTMVILGILKAL